MRRLELWLWRVWDPVRGRWYTTRYRMTGAEAASRHPEGTKVEGSLEVREVDPDARYGYFNPGREG